MKVAVLFSGGKDSTLALYRAQKKNEIKYLVSIRPDNPESYMFHYPAVWVTRLQAESLGIPIKVEKTRGGKEKELKDLERVLKEIKREVGGVVSGAIESRYQKGRIKKVAGKLNLKVLSPLWKEKPDRCWKQLLSLGFETIITAVRCEGLGKDWLGRTVDREVLKELKQLSQRYNFHLSGEGGELETLVTDGPTFDRRIRMEEAEKIWDKKTESGYLEIKKASLE